MTPDVHRHAARAALYAGVAGAFQYPDEQAVAELTAPELHEGLREAVAAVGLVDADDVERLVAALDAVDPDRLPAAYDRLFGLPDEGTYPVVPYEAHYTVADDVSDRQRRIATVSGLLDAFGLDLAEEFAERHDHVAVELELAQVLAGRRAVVRDTEDLDDDRDDDLARAEATLLSEHLDGFVPAFAHELRETVGDERPPALVGDAGTDAAVDSAAGVARDGDTADAVDYVGVLENADPDAVAVECYVAAADCAATLVSADEAAHPDDLAVPTADAASGGGRA